jgi:hypothetical protein
VQDDGEDAEQPEGEEEEEEGEEGNQGYSGDLDALADILIPRATTTTGPMK